MASHAIEDLLDQIEGEGDPFGAAVRRLRSGDEWMSWAACRSPSTCPGLLAPASSPRLPPPVAKASANAAANGSSLLDPAGYPDSAAETEGAASRLLGPAAEESV